MATPEQAVEYERRERDMWAQASTKHTRNIRVDNAMKLQYLKRGMYGQPSLPGTIRA